MGNWTRTKAAGLLFAAAAAVYSDGLVRAMAADKASPAASSDTKSTAGKKKATTKSTKPAAEETLAKADSTKAAEHADESKSSGATVDPFAEPLPVPVVAAKEPVEALTDKDVNVTDAGLVEIHVNDANLGEVLKMLSLQLERNILASKEVRGTVTANLYDVTVKEALDAILRANDCGYREKGNVVYVYTKKELEQIEKDERKQVTETFRVYYTPAANAVNMLKPVLSPEAQVAFTTAATAGIESGGKDAGGNSHATEDTIVITDFPDRIEQVRKILKEVDRRPQQILVEAVILRDTLNETNELGVDFTVLGGVDFNSLTNIAGSIAGNTPTGQMADNHTASIEAGGSGLKVGVITNNVSVFVNALEGVTDTSVVANPKVLVLNKQQGAVHVGARLGYRTAVSTETLTADDVKFLEIGTRLNFRPYIGNDGYIRMEISPKDSSGSVNSQGLPSEFVTEVTSNVMVRDGKTIVIGGLFRESSDTNRSQVPGLGNLPVAGPLFRKQKDSTIREEVIILLTPHIVKDEDAFAGASEEELRHIERLRVGTRHGMMPWGRERLAESAYQKAVEELAKAHPDRKKALWHLNCATNLNPKFTEAIELKAQLTGEEVSSVDNSTIKSFVQRMTILDRARPTTQPTEHLDARAPEPTTQPAQAPAVKTAEVPTPAAKPAETPAEKTAEAPAAEPAEAPAVETAEAPAAEPVATEEETRVAAPSGFDSDTLVEIDAEAASE
jgi:type IV pilus assembly protein PilQ